MIILLVDFSIAQEGTPITRHFKGRSIAAAAFFQTRRL